MFSFCFYYPDGSGGNLTTDNSASAKVDSGYIERAVPEIRRLGSRGIILAVPEVPFAARKRLIELGKQYGLFCTASFTTGEIADALKSNIIDKIDLIAINSDEAEAVAGIKTESADTISVVRMAVQTLIHRIKT